MRSSRQFIKIVASMLLAVTMAYGSGTGSGGGGTTGGSGGGTSGGGGTTTTGVATPQPSPNPATAVPGQVLLRESFGYGTNSLRPAGGGGRLRTVGVHTSLSSFWAEYPWNPSAMWISDGASGAQSWAFSASTTDPKQAPSAIDNSFFNGTMSYISDPGPLGHPAALLPFAAPPIPYQVSLDVLPFPSLANTNIMAVGFTSSPAMYANFENAGQAWMLLRFVDINVDSFNMILELHTNGMTGQSLSVPVIRTSWDTMTVQFDPVNQLVSGYYNGQFMGSLPYQPTAMSFVGFEGEGTVDNLVVQASN